MWLFDSRNNVSKELTPGADYAEGDVQFSTDSKDLAFGFSPKRGEDALSVADLQSGTTTRLNPEDSHAVWLNRDSFEWASDGSLYYFQYTNDAQLATDEGLALWQRSADGTTRRVLNSPAVAVKD